MRRAIMRDAVRVADAVAQRVGNELRDDHRGILGEHQQAPAPEDLTGEVTCRPRSGRAGVQRAGSDLAGPEGRRRHRFEPRILPQAGVRRLLNAGSTPGPDGSAVMSLGHVADLGAGAGWADEYPVPGLRCHQGCAFASTDARASRTTPDPPDLAPRGSAGRQAAPDTASDARSAS